MIPKDIKDKINDYRKRRTNKTMVKIDVEYGYSLAQKELEAKDKEIASLKSVMIAAAEEIQAHWQAHCDSKGYGPTALMNRLEQGIPAQYGYTAGRFAEMKAELEEKDKVIGELKSKVR